MGGLRVDRIPLKPVLGGIHSLANYTMFMKRLNKTESPIFVLLCVLCFQRQPFRFSFHFICKKDTTLRVGN